MEFYCKNFQTQVFFALSKDGVNSNESRSFLCTQLHPPTIGSETTSTTVKTRIINFFDIQLYYSIDNEYIDYTELFYDQRSAKAYVNNQQDNNLLCKRLSKELIEQFREQETNQVKKDDLMQNFQNQISRTVFCNGSNSNSVSLNKINNQNMMPPSVPSISFVQKIKWVVQNTNYDEYSDDNIQRQHRRLKKQLLFLNQQVNRVVAKLGNGNNSMNIKKQRKSLEYDSAKNLIVKQKELQNNHNILDRHRRELEMLKKKTEKLEHVTKDDIQQQIQQTLQFITETKAKIKQLKAKNKEMEGLIMNPDALINQMKRISQDLQLAEIRKIKVEKKKDISNQQIAKSQQKLNSIQDEYQIAQNYFSEHYEQEVLEEQNKQMERQMNHKKLQLQIIRKKVQSINQTKQQKYHQQLKKLEECVNKAKHASARISDIEIEVNNSKKMIRNLSEKLEQCNGNIKDKIDSENIQEQIDFDKQSQVFNQFMTQVQPTRNKVQENRYKMSQNEQTCENNIPQQMHMSDINQLIPLDIKDQYEQAQQEQQLNVRSRTIKQKTQKSINLNTQAESLYSNNNESEKQFQKISQKVVDTRQKIKKKDTSRAFSFEQIKQQFFQQNNFQNQANDINDNQTEIKQQTDFEGDASSFNQSRLGNYKANSSFSMKKQERVAKPVDIELNKFKNQLSQIQGKLNEKRKYKIEVDLATVRESIQIAHKTKFGKHSKDFDQFFKDQ